MKLADLSSYVAEGLPKMQKRLLETARAHRKENEHYDIDTLQQLEDHIEAAKEQDIPAGWALIGWDGSDETEAAIKEATGFTIRNIPYNPPMKKSVDNVSGKPAVQTVWIARAY